MVKSGFFLSTTIIARALQSLSGNILSTGQVHMGFACVRLESEIKKRAPVDTGHLRASYGHRVSSSGDLIFGHVGTNVHYAIHQEFGTIHQSGKPHIRPAIDAIGGKIARDMGRSTMRDAI